MQPQPGILSLHVLPVEDLRNMLLNTEEALPSTMHFPVSSEDTLHFYRYLCTHVLIADKQFLLLIDVPIQDCAQQLEIYEVFNLVTPHRNFLACYNIDSKYLAITYNETKAVEISEQQFSTYQKAKGQFCSINTPLQPLAIHHHVSQLYMQRTRLEWRRDAHYRSGKPTVQPSPYQYLQMYGY